MKSQIEKVLITDESRTDEEMIDFLMNELKLDKDLAKKCLDQRGMALGDPEFQLRFKHD